MPAHEAIGSGDDVVGLRFAPGRWPDLPDCSVRELSGITIPLEEVASQSLEVYSTEAPSVRARALREAVIRLLEERTRPTPVLAQIDACFHSDASTRTLADAVGRSERQIRRHIHGATGITVRDLRQLGRFQRFVALVQSDVARGSSASIAGLAMSAGYADQSHLHRASWAFAASTPGVYLDRTRHACAGHDHAVH